MADSAAPVRSPAALVPPLASITAAAAGGGLLQTLLPLRLRALGYSTDQVGFVVTFYSLGFIIGCLGAAVLIRSVGHVRAACAFAAVAAITILVLEWHPDFTGTILTFAITGIGSAGMSVVTESWLNELAVPEWRGSLLTIYVVLLAMGWAAGQALGLGLDVEGSRMLILAAGFYVVALIPVAAVDVAAPKVPETAKIDLLRAFRVAPVGALSCLHTGLVAATFIGIGPLYGEGLGLGTRQIIWLMLASQFGMVLQWPLGIISDRFDRRFLLIAMCLMLVALGAAMIALGPHLPFLGQAVLFACFAGVAESFYPIGVAHANDRADPSEYVLISSNLLVIWAVGRMIGPIAGASALKQAGPSGLVWYAIGLSLAFALYASWRIFFARRLVAETREEFVAYPTTSPTVLEWIQFRRLRSTENDRTRETPT
jgi:MFS family permease